MGSAVAMTNDLVESVSGGKGAAADGKTAAIKALGSGGGGSAKKKARGGRREEKKRR